MLHTLHLKNFALVDEEELTLHDGFNVITGETGAGKSLILDALSLCTGARGGSDIVRYGTKGAELTAYFDTQDREVQAWFEAHERDFCEGEIVIRRQIADTGRSKAWINGVPASLHELKALGLLLVNIHSQHAGLDLLKPNYALHWLDTVAGLTEQALAVKSAYHTWQDCKQAEENAKHDQSARLDRINLLEAKLADIEPLLSVDMDTVNAKYDELSNMERLTEDAFTGANLIDADNDAPSVLSLLSRVLKLCEHNSTISPAFSEAYDNLSEAYELIKDAQGTLISYADNASLDHGELEHLNTLMSLAHRLAQKYRTPIEDLIKESQTWQTQLDELNAVLDPEDLAKKTAEALAHYTALATTLQAKRSEHAPKLCDQLTQNLAPLALPTASCEFAFDERQTPSAHGLYDIDLLFSANVGLPLAPLHKVASGGELSRMSLVMQVMRASRQAGLPLLVFDEVDVGISGGTAQVVGELLRDLGGSQQLIAITHQAQVAACGHSHLLVQKEHGTISTSRFCNLTGEVRVRELARMSGGVNITDETLAHAKSLLDAIGDS